MKTPPGTETGSARTVELLFVSPSRADHAALCDILHEPARNPEPSPGWMVHAAGSLASAADALAGQGIPIVISDDDLLPGTWKTLLESISLLPDPPMLIVASRLADERLWAEALNLGAWDVLATPFDKQEVLRIVAGAWRHWQDRRKIQAEHYAAAPGT